MSSAQNVTPRDRIVEGLRQELSVPMTLPSETSKTDIGDRIGAFVKSLEDDPTTPQSETQAPSEPELSESELLGAPKEKLALRGGLEIPTKKWIINKPVVKEKHAQLAFYYTAQEYLDTRGAGKSPQTILHYEVRTQSKGGNAGPDQNVTLILGEDYAALKREGAKGITTKIYDFKFNRLLTIQPQIAVDGQPTGREQFDNLSLYPRAYRNIKTVKNLTRNGKVRVLEVGKGAGGKVKTLDAFWIESAMSWAAVQADIALDIIVEDSAEGAVFTVTKEDGNKEGETVFKAAFPPKIYENPAFKQTLLAFAHHEWPLHPQILQALYEFDAPPSNLEMLSYSPKAPKGETQIWALKDRTTANANFPLPPKALSITERKPVVPLAMIINEAAHDKAHGGMQSLESIEQDFFASLDEAVPLTSWLLGQRYIAYSGGCGERDVGSMCDVLSKIEATDGYEQTHLFRHYIMSRHLAQSKASRIDAVKIVQPYLDDPKTPAIVLRTAAMARAKIKTSTAKTADLENIHAETILKAALEKDPYDPNIYVGLAQVYAANGAMEQSWDIYDALRAGIPTRSAVKLKIDKVENRIRASAPGYFVQPAE